MVRPPGLQRGELLLEHLDDKWRQAFRRLVEEQDLGVHHQRAGDGEHVLLAAAQRARPLVSPERRALRSEEHTSELQSLAYLVCRLLLEKKKKIETRRCHCWSVEERSEN